MIKLIVVNIYIFSHLFILSNANSNEITKFYNLEIDRNIELDILCDREIKIGSLNLHLDDQIFSLNDDIIMQREVFNKNIKFQKVIIADDINQIKNKFLFRFVSFFRYYFFDINNKVYFYYNDKHYKDEKVHSISISIPRINIKNGDLINFKFKNKILLQNISIYFSKSLTNVERNSIQKYNIYNKEKDTFIFFEIDNSDSLINELFNVHFFTLFYKDESVFKNIDFLIPLNFRISEVKNKIKDIYIPEDNLFLKKRIYSKKIKILISTEVPYDKLIIGRFFNRRLEKIYFKHQDKNAICNVL